MIKKRLKPAPRIARLFGPYKKGEARKVVGMGAARGFQAADIRRIEDTVRTVRKEVGDKNVKSIILFGGARRHVLGEERRETYGDVDLCIIMNPKMRRGFEDWRWLLKIGRRMEKTGIHLHPYTSPDIEKHIEGRNPHEVAMLYSITKEGIPIYNRGAGFKIQRKINKMISREFKAYELAGMIEKGKRGRKK